MHEPFSNPGESPETQDKLTDYASPLLLAALLLQPASRATQTLAGPKVVTSASVDCSSLQSIVRDLIKPGMEDQEKVLALYNWFRRTIYHYRMMGADRRDFLRAINSYGCLLCGSQAANFRALLNAAGFKARVVSANAGGEMGHTIVEVWYQHRWHVIDTMTSFYVMTRGADRTIASMADLAQDPTLVTNAETEGRSGPAFLYCIRHKEDVNAEYALRKKMMHDGMVQDIAWTLFIFWPNAEGQPQTVRTFWTIGPKYARYRNADDAYGEHYEPGLLDITLKPHEEYVRLWNNVGRWMENGNYDTVGPFHTCGLADEQDPINFKHYEPYRKNKTAFGIDAYRYYANGWLDWEPRGSEILLGSKLSNLTLEKKSGMLAVLNAAKTASWVMPIKSPYAVVESRLDLEFQGARPHSKVTVVCQPEDDAYNHGLRPQMKTFAARPGPLTVAFDVGSRKDVSGGVFSYRLIVKLSGGSCQFAVRRIRTVFMLNMHSLPFFEPGLNTVTVSKARPGSLKDSRLVVTYDWAEGAQWKNQRTDRRVVRSFPAQYTVRVNGPKMPRMEKLVMKLVPRREA